LSNQLIFAAKIKVVKTFMASNLLFMLENKSWGIKANSKEMPIRCGPGNPNLNPKPNPGKPGKPGSPPEPQTL